VLEYPARYRKSVARVASAGNLEAQLDQLADLLENQVVA
jgi:hypothetical protein